MTMPPLKEGQPFSWSLGETAALATKAARGAGLAWGLADEAGFAVSWLQARGIPGLAALCRYLKWRETGKLAALPDAPGGDHFYCPIAVGTAYMDGALDQVFAILAVREPVLILPFIAVRAGPQTLEVCLDQLSLHLSKNGVSCPYLDTALLISAANCRVQMPAGDIPTIQPPDHATRVPSYFLGCVQTLQEFAKKTYAPATEESRLAGAGAGLNDND